MLFRATIAIGLMLSFLFDAVAAGSSDRVSVAETNWVAFQRTPSARMVINLANVQTNLLNTAVFHETNKRRQQHKLPLFRMHTGANQTAAIQSAIMLARGEISHDNPEHPRFKTLPDRAEASKLKFRLIAENVATAFGRKYEGGKKYYVREVSGKKILSYAPNGADIPPHTYASFAQSLVERWMNSPGHRKNILNPDVEYLGVSCLPEADRSGMVKFFCTQVFFTPLDRE